MFGAQIFGAQMFGAQIFDVHIIDAHIINAHTLWCTDIWCTYTYNSAFSIYKYFCLPLVQPDSFQHDGYLWRGQSVPI